MIVSRYSDIYINDPSLRPYQQKAKKEIFEAWDKVDNVMFQMPTGTGKTRLFTSIIRDINKYSIRIKEAVKILIVAHRTELIDQIDESLNKYCIAHNVIAGRRQRNFKYPVNVASIQTLTHPNNLADAKKLNVQFIIIDEAHHALASTYKKLWDMYPGSKKLGVTATPWRMNHQGFRDLFDTIITSMPVKEFIRQGYLSAYKYYSLRTDSDIQKTIDGIELDRFGEYRESSMEEKMDVGSIRAQLLNSYLSLAKGKKGIIYAINIEHAKHISSEYKAAGYVTVCIDSKTPASERKELVEKFRKGQIDIIVNVDIFSEGFDCPDIEFIQLARPTRSLVKYLQQVGRGLRTTKNKQECVILDNVGMYARFGLPNARRHWKQHFLGKNVSEEPKSRFITGTGRTRHADMSEGTEDMDLIQDINSERHKETIAVGFDDFFPLFGVSLGKTTLKQAEDGGSKVEIWNKGPYKYMDVNDVDFWDFEGCGKFTSLYWTKHECDFPDSWKSLGFSWDNSYNAWLSAFRKLGFTIKVTKEPKTRYYDGRKTLKADTEAISKDGLLKFDLDFDYGEDGNETSSPKSLYSLKVDYLGYVSENSSTIKKTEKGKDYLLKYDLDGEIDTTTIAPVTGTGPNPLKADDVEKIKHAFDKKTTSYKYFWLMSILDIYKDKQVENIQFRQILVKMVSKAWKYVFLLNGKFSQSDKLPMYLINLQQETGLRRDSTESEVENELNKQFDSIKLRSKLGALLKNVPYRFLSPWIPYTNNEDVMKKSWSQETRSPYELYTDHVVISKLWQDFFVEYYNCLELLVEYGLDSYLIVSQDSKEANDFYNKRFPTLNKLLKGINRIKKMYVREVREFFEKYNFSLKEGITPADIMKIMPESECEIDSEGRKRVHVPGELWSLKILDKLLSEENMSDSYDHVQLLEDYGLEEFKKEDEKANDSKYFYRERFPSLSKFIKGIKKYNKETKVKQFLMKHGLPLSGEIRPADILNLIPESEYIIDDEGQKHVNVPGGFWTFTELDRMLSK